MIKINLLPKTIDQKRVIRNTAILMGCVLVLVIAVGVAFACKVRGDADKMKELADATEAWKTRVEGIQKQAQQVRDGIKPIQQKLDFINKVLDYNLKFPKLYEEVAKWTYEKASLSSLQCDGQQVVMQAHVRTLDDLGRYLLNMYRATSLFTEVTISGIPGYGQGTSGQAFTPPGEEGLSGGPIGGSMAGLAGITAIETGVERAAAGAYAAAGIDVTVTCRLKTPIVAPEFGGAAAGQPGQPGMPGMPGMPAPGSPGVVQPEPMMGPGRGGPGASPPPTM